MTNHYGHTVDVTEETLAQEGAPFCTDCEETVTEVSQVIKEINNVSETN